MNRSISPSGHPWIINKMIQNHYEPIEVHDISIFGQLLNLLYLIDHKKSAQRFSKYVCKLISYFKILNNGPEIKVVMSRHKKTLFLSKTGK